jgi:AcrR family transcriptional regulator
MARPARPGAHEALLEAARAEFARAGLAAARVEDVARRAGVSKGAFYLHFASKEDAFREILQRFLGALETLAQQRQEAAALLDGGGGRRGRPVSLEERLEEECRLDTELLELLWRHRHFIPAVDGAGTARWSGLVSEFRRRMRATVSTRIAARQAAGLLRPDVDPVVAADVIMGSYEDFGRRMASLREKPDLAAWARTFLLIVYQGLLTRRSGMPARRTP